MDEGGAAGGDTEEEEKEESVRCSEEEGDDHTPPERCSIYAHTADFLLKHHALKLSQKHGP